MIQMKRRKNAVKVLSLDRMAIADAEGVPGSTTNQPPMDPEFDQMAVQLQSRLQILVKRSVRARLEIMS